MVLPWLESVLSTSFSNCPSHQGEPRSECNMYCLSVVSPGAFCYYCRSSCHKDQHVIQIRRLLYHDVVRAAKIDIVLDISGTFRVSIAFSLLNNLA
ncbi:hypothetical protein NL676_018071 [Syzygium grande]|nr:hypothetical protein NL676_018071 [Syzygium grande]